MEKTSKQLTLCQCHNIYIYIYMCVFLYNINMNLNGYINKLFIKTLKLVILLPKRKKENLIS